MVSRFTVLISGFVVAYAALVFNLYTLQLTHGQYYTARAASQYAANDLLRASRGSIYFTDKNGNKLAAASNKDFPMIYAVPTVIEDASEAANLLAPALDLQVADLTAKFKKKDSYELIEKKVDAAAAEQVRALNIKGIYVEDEAERFYPFNDLASQVLGFVAPNSTDNGESGKYGLESLYNTNLSGVAGSMNNGKIVAPQPGEDITLTIDPNIQTEAVHILSTLVSQFSSPGGSVVVEDPKTGKILAMDSVPHFDPNDYSSAKVANFLNPVVQDVYEPGSMVKVLTMAAGIDAGKITPETTYDDTGVLVVSGKTIRNWDLQAHGVMTMTNVIENSLNTGAAFAERRTGDKIFKQYLDQFGFGNKTGIDLPGELAGNLSQLKPNAPAVAYATASFGQGIAVTPLEMVNSIAALANGGVLMRPYVNATGSPQEVRRVVTQDTAKKVTGMMVSAVDKARIAHINGYSIAGKTGTAQVPDFVHGGYSDKVIDSYVGYGPTTDPRFVILIKLDAPQNAPLAGETVVPAFRNLAQFILNYENVPPDRLDSGN